VKEGFGVNRLMPDVKRLWRQDGLVIGLLLFFILGGGLFSLWAGLAGRFSVFIYPGVAIFSLSVVGLAFFVFYSLYVLFLIRPERPISFLYKKVRSRTGGVGLLAPASVILLFSFFLSSISSLKTMIPMVNPFSWDYTFSEIDSLLLGGQQAWCWVHPVITAFDLTMPINALYNGWFFFVFGMLFWQIVDVSRPSLRERYLISYILCWVINGTIFAMVFSSAGPAFFGRIYHDLPNPYEPLMSYLATANGGEPAWALGIQEYLWGVYSQGSLQIGSGISAMPSMHVSLAWLGFLFFYKLKKGPAFLILGYVIVVMVGSVHLAWHYAVDGILAIITTSIIWFAVGALGSSRQCEKNVGNQNV